MTKINENNSHLSWLYKIGFLIILTLPILSFPPYLFPADWGKSIIFRSIIAILLFAFLLKNDLTPRVEASTSLSSLKKNPTAWALCGLFIIYLLASIFSVDPNFSFWGSPYRSGGFVNFASYFIFAILTFILFKKKDWKKAWIISISIGMLVSLIAIIQYYGLFTIFFEPMAYGPVSTMGNSILLSIYLLLLFFPTLSLAIKEKNIQLKIFYISALLIFLYAMIISGSRAAYLGVIGGVIYFLLAYPKKLRLLKICLGIFTILIISVIGYLNAFQTYPSVLQDNRIFQTLEYKLSIKSALNDERYKAWQTVILEIKDKPILGWGPENLSVGFDKNYNPNVTPSPWWDRAHNLFLNAGAETGILGIIAYLSLFIVLFWQLQRGKQHSDNKIMVTGLQAGVLGYLIASLFSFDSSGTYLIFFLIIGYSLYLTTSNSKEDNISNQKAVKDKGAIIGISILVLAIFLWQYNLVPFQVNAKINKADSLIKLKRCDQALSVIDSVLPSHSFLDSYKVMQYVQFEKTCSTINPQNNLAYAQKGISLLSEAVKIQPLYTRYWIWLGNLTTTVAEQETDITTKNTLLKEAKNYYYQASQLAPKHQEILIGLANIEKVSGNYQQMKTQSEECAKIGPGFGDCYFYLALSQIYLNDNNDANKNILLAESKKYDINSEASLVELVNAYGQKLDYKNLAPLFSKLVLIRPDNIQYHSFLSMTYYKLGENEKGKWEANIVSQLSTGQ